ncbi:MAG: tetratricopeptide repeat protein [Candidatus Scalindua sp.]|nr:tetratricopeptide repeat protein [Candidatus Scalindua sp.]
MNNYHFSSGVPLASPITTPLNASSAPSHVVVLEKVVRSESLFISRLQAGCLLYGFWIFFFTVLLTARFAFCDTQFISSLNAKVTGLRFFEGDVKGQPYGQRKYSTVFSKSATRFIYWEMALAFPKSNRKSYFTIVSKFYNPHGNFMTRLTLQSNIEPGWTSSYHYHGYGWKTPGNWEIGTYRVDIFVDNQNVTSGTFTITYGGVPHKKSSPAADEADIYFEKGLEYYNNERWDEAIAEINKAMALNPEYKDSFYKFGLAHYKGGFYDKAITAYSLSLKLNPNDFRVYCDRGLAYGKNGQYDKAIADYDQAIKLDPKHAKVYVGRGVAFKNKGEDEKAIADYTQAIKLNSTYALAYYNRGLVHQKKGRYEKAIADFDQALKSNPKYTNAYYSRGLAYHYTGQYEKAVADYTESIRLNPKDADAYFGRGYAQYYKGQYDKAIADYDQALKLDPKYTDVYYNRGLAHHKKGLYEKAVADYDQTIKLNPNFTAAKQNRDLALKKQSPNIQKTIAEYTQAIERDPENVDLYIARGDAYFAKGQNDEAIADYTQAIKLEPTEALTYHNRGGLYIVNGEYDKAIADLTQAIKLDSTYALAYYNRGIAHNQKGDYRNALEDVEKAVDLGQKVDAEFFNKLRKASEKDLSSSSGADTRVSKSKEESSKTVEDLSKQTGEKENFIPTINGSVTELRFYESGMEDTPYGQRTYQTLFSQSGARYIYWELILAFPKQNRRTDFNIMAKYYDPEGNLIREWVTNSYIETGWTSSYHNSGYGWNEPGKWKQGTYRADLFVEGQRVASGTFTVTTGNLSSEKIQQPVREEDQKSGSGEQLHKSTENNRKEQHKEEDQVLHPADNQSMITGGEKVVIPSMNARVAGLRFYETGNSWKPCGKGEYGTSFSRSTTRNVNWELSLNYPSPTKKSYFTITAEYYDPHGNIIIRQSKESSIQPGRTSSSHFHGYGWSQPGKWETGTYRVDIIVEGQKVASGSFAVTSGQ